MPTSAACSDGRVVDAVAHEADHVAARLEREDDAVLLRGRHSREDVGSLGALRERGDRSAARASAPSDHPRSVEPDRRTNMPWRPRSLSPVRTFTGTPSRFIAANIA